MGTRGSIIPVVASLMMVGTAIGPVSAFASAPPASAAAADTGVGQSLWDESGLVAPPPPVPAAEVKASRDGIGASIDDALSQAGLGPAVGAAVASAAPQGLLFDDDGTAPLIPASLTKILTAAAVLQTLDSSFRFTTRTVLDAQGRLVLVGGGDPLLRGARSEGRGASLQTLAQVTASRLLARQGSDAEVELVVDGNGFVGPELAAGWTSADLSACYVRPVVTLMVSIPSGQPCQPAVAPQLSAGEVFADYLRQAGLQVGSQISEAPQRVEGEEIAAVSSPPLPTLVEQMLLTSDNTGAEMLAHAAGGALLDDPSFAGGAEATARVLEELGIGVEGLVLADASGMSTDNRASALMVLDVLQAAGREPSAQRLWPVLTGLPTAGFDGTLASRFSSAEALAGQGDVRAKTGTLTDVSALAGQVLTDSGQLLRFAFISNSARDTLQARADLDEAAAELASCGCD